MKELESYLERAGFEVNLVGGSCPFQIEANHRDGFSIYFRSRHECAVLEVYDCHYDYFSGLPGDDELIWADEFCCWDEPNAGYLDFDEAFYVFWSLWSEARAALDISPVCHLLSK